MRRLRPKADVMPARFADDRLKQFALVEGADDRSDRIHQLEMLSLHVAGKKPRRIGSELEEPAVKRDGELSTHRPYRVERLPDEINLFGRHDADRSHRKLVDVRFEGTSPSLAGADPQPDRPR